MSTNTEIVYPGPPGPKGDKGDPGPTGAAGGGAGMSIAALKAMAPSPGVPVTISDPGREGVFLWDPADHSAALTHRQLNCTVNPTTDILTAADHYLETGSCGWVLTNTNGLTAKVLYFTIRQATNSTNTFKLATSFANAKAGVAIDVTGAAVVFIHGGDGHEGIYIIPDGYPGDGSGGAWRRVMDSDTYLAQWWKPDPTYAHNQAILSSAANLIPNGSTLVIPGVQLPISHCVTIRWREGITLKGLPGNDIHGDGTANDGIRIHRSHCTVDGVRVGNFRGSLLDMELTSKPGGGTESAGIRFQPLQDVDGGDFILDYCRVKNCRFYELDNGVTTQCNWKNNGPSQTIYYPSNHIWLEDNYVSAARNGFEIFASNNVFIRNNIIFNEDPIINDGSVTTRFIRCCGSQNVIIEGNRCYGWAENVLGAWGITVEPSGLSDWSTGARHAGKTLIEGNYIETNKTAFTICGTKGPVTIRGNIHTANPLTAPSTEGTTFCRRLDVGYSEGGVNGVVTISNAAPAVVTWTPALHYFTGNERFRFYTSGTLPSPLVPDTDYYMKDLAGVSPAANWKVSATPGGVAIDTTTAGSGTHQIVMMDLMPGLKFCTDYLELSDNVAYGVGRFYHASGRGRCVYVLGNHHIGNNYVSGCFIINDTFGDIPGLEKTALTVVRDNTSIVPSVSTLAPVQLAAACRTGETWIVDANDFGWNPAQTVPVVDSGTGQTLIRNRYSNTRVSNTMWTDWFATWPEFGPIEPYVGNKP